MIPYAILSGEIIFYDGSSLDVRFLELSDRHLTFRLPKTFLKNVDSKISFHLSFYQMDQRDYHSIDIKNFTVSCMEKEEFYDLYRLDCEEIVFRNAAKKLTEEYLSYMENRLYLDDAELSASMTSYSVEGDSIFAKSWKGQKEEWVQQIKEEYDERSWDYLKNGVDGRENPAIKLAYSLEDLESMKHFLKDNLEDFCKWYWTRYDLSWHPLASLLPEKVLVGNPYCPCLFPGEDEMEQFLIQSKKKGITVDFQLAPIPQCYYAKIIRQIDQLALLAEKENQAITIYVGDQGIKNHICKYYEKTLVAKDGVLMKKEIRDPRLQYRYSDSSKEGKLFFHANKERKLFFHSIEDGMCLPFYQCNTGTFCPIYSLCTQGKRDAYVRVTDCPGYCQDHHMIYPSHLHLLGRFNSILGWNIHQLSNGSMIKNQKGWVVINL
ncbi:MAG: hypothetical protein Q4E53_06530 [Eubacteriales bacterium]|nr:hypothetical protein [Eubacteriales bacterium]